MLLSQAIAFCASVPHGEALARMLESEGIRAETVHGNMIKADRERVLRHFREGEAVEWQETRDLCHPLSHSQSRCPSGSIRVLTNFNVLTEGFDAPGCDTIVMCRPTLSAGLYLQVTPPPRRKPRADPP